MKHHPEYRVVGSAAKTLVEQIVPDIPTSGSMMNCRQKRRCDLHSGAHTYKSLPSTSGKYLKPCCGECHSLKTQTHSNNTRKRIL